ncbi:glycogen/starch/alpha-glucan phosphorylase, partial [Salmonella enterica subsp. enterica serovar Kentucky]|nr:glycogen/starch/alpha-glucan phosphorylase [Salmonella enterica subsp. enterica serovar Kentucky]
MFLFRASSYLQELKDLSPDIYQACENAVGSINPDLDFIRIDKKARWIETEEILAVAYDQIIPGYDTDATNTLRLWNAQASSEI